MGQRLDPTTTTFVSTPSAERAEEDPLPGARVVCGMPSQHGGEYTPDQKDQTEAGDEELANDVRGIENSMLVEPGPEDRAVDVVDDHDDQAQESRKPSPQPLHASEHGRWDSCAAESASTAVQSRDGSSSGSSR